MDTQFIKKSLAPATVTMSGPLEVWLYGLLNASVVGGATAVVSALGLATAHGLGVSDIPAVNWHTIEVVFTSGAVSKLAIYLAQGLPALNRTNTTTDLSAASQDTSRVTGEPLPK